MAHHDAHSWESTCSIAGSYGRVNRKGIRSSRSWSKIARGNKDKSRLCCDSLLSRTFHSPTPANFAFSPSFLCNFSDADFDSVSFPRETKVHLARKVLWIPIWCMTVLRTLLPARNQIFVKGRFENGSLGFRKVCFRDGFVYRRIGV